MRHEQGFTITELLVSVTITLLVAGAALTTFKNAVDINESAAQLGDANQNLRAGTGQMIRDLMMAGRVIGAEGVAMPNGGVQSFGRPGPTPGLTFVLVTDEDTSLTLNLPSITSGYQLGPTINGSQTDIVTILTVDEFMPVITTPPVAAPTATEGTIAPDGLSVTLPANSLWILGDTVNDTPPIQRGDLVFYKSPNGNAIQTVTSTDATHIYFAANSTYDPFHFNQPAATNWPIAIIKNGVAGVIGPAAFATKVSLFRALMITYYVDNTTTPGTPRLTRQVNAFTPQALAGVVEDLDLTYDLVDGVVNPTEVHSLPYTSGGVTYNSGQIRKVNLHVGVRSETISNPSRDYVRNHITTSVDVRSLASVDRYKSAGEVQ